MGTLILSSPQDLGSHKFSQVRRITVDGRNPAPRKNPWNDDSPVKNQQIMVSNGFKVVQDFVHPQYVLFPSNILHVAHIPELQGDDIDFSSLTEAWRVR